MDIEKLLKEVTQIEEQSEFVVSWFAKKYNKTIRRIGHFKQRWLQNLGRLQRK